MSGHWGILVSDPCLQNQFTQVELRSLKTHVSEFFVTTQLFNFNESHVVFSMKDWIFDDFIEIWNLGHDDHCLCSL